MAKKEEPAEDPMAEYLDLVADDPSGEGLIEQITTITPENIAEIIANLLDGWYHEDFEVHIDAANTRHSVRIHVANEALGIDDGFILFVRKDNAA